MKKFFTLLATLVLAVTANAERQVVFESASPEGEGVLSWSAPAAACPNLPEVKPGDVFYITFSQKSSESNYPQVNLLSADWTALQNYAIGGVSSFPYEAVYTVVPASAEKINAGHEVHFHGDGCYISKVEFEPTTSTEDYSNAIWIGNYAMGTGWNNGFSINKSAFASAAVGDEVRIYYTDKIDGSFNPFTKADWTDFSFTKSVNDKYVSIILTQETLDIINEKGSLRICGSGYTVTHVDIVAPDKYAEAVEVTFDDNGFFTASYFDGMSLDAKVEFTYNSENASGHIYWGPMGISSDIWGKVGATYQTGFEVKKEGENVVSCKLSDIADILNTDYNSQGIYGAYWRIWGWDECKNTRVSIKVYDNQSSTAEKFESKGNVDSQEIVFADGMTYATYVPKIALDFSSVLDIEAYVVTAVSGSHAILEQVTTVPANTPIIVKGSTSVVPIATEVNYSAVNILSAAVYDHQAVEGDYALSYKNGEYGFFPVTDRTISAGKAYLTAPSSAKGYTISFADATAISTVEAANADSSVAHNLAGQRVNANAKGIVIKNGQKYIVK